VSLFGVDQQTLAVIGLLLLARLGDIGSTWVATPNLALEANPIVRKFRWGYAWATLLICFVPLLSLGVGIALTVASFLVTSSNLSKGWVMRSLGEDGYTEVMQRAALRSSLPVALAFVALSAAAFALPAWLVLVTSGGEDTWSYWAATGMLLYALVLGGYGALSAVRLFRSIAPVRLEDPSV
jgi:hypothetical protein